MPITEVQSKSGSFDGASGAATLDVGVAAGSVLLLFISSAEDDVAAGTQLPPSGFADTTGGYGGDIDTRIVYRGPVQGLAAGETSWTIDATSGQSGRVLWTVLELEGLDPDAPLDVKSSVVDVSSGTTISSGASARSTTYDGLVVAFHAVATTSGAASVLSGHTNGLVELAQVSGAGTGAIAGAYHLTHSVSVKPVQSLAQWESTVTSSTTMSTGISDAGVGQMLVLSAAGAKREANIVGFWGFSSVLSGYPASHSVSPASNRYWDTQTGSPTIDTDGLRLAGSASAQQIGGPTLTSSGNPRAGLRRLRFRINSVTGDLELAKSDASVVDADIVLRYVSASQKLGIKIGAGTEQLSDQTVTTGVWYDVDWRLLTSGTSGTCDWRVNYGSGWVEQTQASHASSGSLVTWVPWLGWTAASTGNVSYAYDAWSLVAGHYPLGDYAVVFLGPDPAGTPTVSGTANNFRRFTANGTLDGSFVAADVRDALDDWPPTFGASADGLAVVTAHATDYCEVPLATYNAAANGRSIRAAKVVAPIWAASGTAATCRLSGYDGSAATTLFSEADPGADTSSTPPWVAKMWRPTNGWDQAKLDAAALRIGAADATPDIGPHALGMEALLQEDVSQPVFGEAGALPRVEADTDPLSGGILQLRSYTGAGQALEVTYEVSGTPSTYTVPESSNPHVRTIDAPDVPTLNWVSARFA